MSLKKYNQIKDIPNLAFEGYVWLSDAESPQVLRNETFDFTSINMNPFIIEALLYNQENQISIHIQHTGDYQIVEYDLKNYSTEQLVPKAYLPHRLEGVEKVKFQQLWIPEGDPNCEGMEVLTLKAIVFCGFKRKQHE